LRLSEKESYNIKAPIPGAFWLIFELCGTKMRV